MAEQLWELEPMAEPTGTDGRALTVRGARTRERILEAALEIFATLGYHDASIVKITEAANVAQGTFYLYFESKKQIFDQLVMHLNRRVRHAMSEHSATADTRAERERLGFEGYFRFTAEHPAIYGIIRQAAIVSPGVLREHYSRIAQGYVRGLRDAMDDGQMSETDPEVLAWILMGIGEMIGMRWVLWGDTQEVPEEVLEQMHQFITRGLGLGEGT